MVLILNWSFLFIWLISHNLVWSIYTDLSCKGLAGQTVAVIPFWLFTATFFYFISCFVCTLCMTLTEQGIICRLSQDFWKKNTRNWDCLWGMQRISLRGLIELYLSIYKMWNNYQMWLPFMHLVQGEKALEEEIKELKSTCDMLQEKLTTCKTYNCRRSFHFSAHMHICTVAVM